MENNYEESIITQTEKSILHRSNVDFKEWIRRYRKTVSHRALLSKPSATQPRHMQTVLKDI